MSAPVPPAEDPQAKFEREVAALKAAKGFRPGLWLEQNSASVKRFLALLVPVLLVIGGIAYMLPPHDRVGFLIVSCFTGPIAMGRIAASDIGRRRRRGY